MTSIPPEIVELLRGATTPVAAMADFANESSDLFVGAARSKDSHVRLGCAISAYKRALASAAIELGESLANNEHLTGEQAFRLRLGAYLALRKVTVK